MRRLKHGVYAEFVCSSLPRQDWESWPVMRGDWPKLSRRLGFYLQGVQAAPRIVNKCRRERTARKAFLRSNRLPWPRPTINYPPCSATSGCSQPNLVSANACEIPQRLPAVGGAAGPSEKLSILRYRIPRSDTLLDIRRDFSKHLYDTKEARRFP